MNNKSNMPAKPGQRQRLHLNEGELSKICAERGEGKSLLQANMDSQLVYEDFEIDNDYLILYAE